MSYDIQRSLAAVLAAGLCCLFAGSAAEIRAEDRALAVERVTPSGDGAPLGKQIVVEFNQPMTPLGRMERQQSEVPVTIAPELPCQWRWINTSTLACNLGDNAALKPARKYSVTVRAGAKSESGAELPADFSSEFSTILPTVSDARFVEWMGPTHPKFLVSSELSLLRDSLEKHLFFSTVGSAKRTGVTLTPGTEPNQWFVEPSEELEPDKKIELKVEPGVVLAEGGDTLPGTESRALVPFKTFGEFKLVGFRCVKNDGSEISAAALPGKSALNCNPLDSLSLVFSSPVLKDAAKGVLRFEPPLVKEGSTVDPWQDVYSWSELSNLNTEESSHWLNLPYGFKANQKYRVFADTDRLAAGELKDEFGRALTGKLDISFTTSHRLPRVHLENQFSVLESEVETHLPLIVNNVNSVKVKYAQRTAAGLKEGGAATLTPYKVLDIAYPFPIKVRELLGGKNGVVSGTIATDPPTDGTQGDSEPTWFFSQVTPFSVHIKIGHHNSLVWVTKLSDGAAVSDAKVSLVVDNVRHLSAAPRLLDEATTGADGVAMLKGTTDIDPKLELLNQWDISKDRIFARIEQGEQLAYVPITWEYEISDSTTYNYSRPKYGHLRAWGTTAQGVYRAGDTIQYKLYVRDGGLNGLVVPPKSDYTIQIIDPLGKVISEIRQVSLSDFNAYDGAVELSKRATVGWYTVNLSAPFLQSPINVLQVLVSDFTPAPFHVTTSVPRKRYDHGDEVVARMEARLHAGGAYAKAPIRLTATLAESPITFEIPDLAGFSFFEEKDAGEESDSSGESHVLHQGESELDEKGDLETRLTIEGFECVHGTLQIEGAAQDDRGKYVADTINVPVDCRDRYVAIKQKDWILEQGKPFTAEFAVVDPSGTFAEGVPIEAKLLFNEVKAVRVKGAGNAYTTKYENEWKEEGECKSVSGRAAVSCSMTPSHTGTYKITATISDSKQRPHTAAMLKWVTGTDIAVWNSDDEFQLSVKSDKAEYLEGETAKVLVRNPFPGATALFSLERFGIMKSWTKVLPSSSEVVEVPLPTGSAPGEFLSVVIASPRVDKPLEEGVVDLGKPAFRMGYVRLPVKDRSRELTVDVKPAKEVYQPRDTVAVDLSVRPKTPGAAATTEPLEIAVAVLDESVFDLINQGLDYFDPFKGFYSLGELDVDNFNILKKLVGRVKFEKKGANPGGDGGGNAEMRSVFKFVSYWNPSVRVDPSGNAKIAFQVPDNLTGWKVLALAASPTDRMGLGVGRFAVNRKTELRSALPNQLREGDSFTAVFTVMNREPALRKLDVELKAEGPVEGLPASKVTVDAPSMQRVRLELPVRVTAPGKVTLRASAGDALDRDSTESLIEVSRRRNPETASQHVLVKDDRITQALEVPKGIEPGDAAASVVFTGSMIGSLEDTFRRMRDYPFGCWEQRLTKAVIASHYLALRNYVPKTFEWEGAEKFRKELAKSAADFQTSNGGMAYFQNKDGYEDPFLSGFSGLAFSWLKELGFSMPGEVETKLHGYLERFLRGEFAKPYYQGHSLDTANAVALAALARAGKLDPKEFKRFEKMVPSLGLFGRALMLDAAVRLDGTGPVRKKILDSIRSAGSESSGKVVFSKGRDDVSSYLIDSATRSDCTILTALLTASEKAPELGIKDEYLAAIARGVSLRRRADGGWGSTQEEVFCAPALAAFSRRFESESLDARVKAILNGDEVGSAHFTSRIQEPVEVEKDIQPERFGTPSELVVEKSGSGSLYAALRLRFIRSSFDPNSVNAGIEVVREYSVKRDQTWKLLAPGEMVKPGDLVRVDLFVTTPAQRYFVVVSDPVPGALEPVNRLLRTAAASDEADAEPKMPEGSVWFGRSDWIESSSSNEGFYFRELGNDNVRFYSESIEAGAHHLSYLTQVVANGEFSAPPVRVEEMYDPDVFGLGVERRFTSVGAP